MARLTVFNQVSLDGYFCDADGDMRWAHKDRQDAEWNAFVQENASGGGMLVFGRVTYEMMAAFWPTPTAATTMPAVADRMNSLPKVVFSASMHEASWNNTTLIRDDIVGAMRRLKAQAGPDMAILGSGTIVSQMASAGLVDEFHIVVNPLVLAAGRTMFEGVQGRLPLRLTRTRVFGNGGVLLNYEPAV